MAFVTVDNLQQGMILSEDVRDINSRLLMSKGQKVGANHLRILRIWGINGVQIVGVQQQKSDEFREPDAEKAAQVKAGLDQLFGKLDLQHPVVREIYQAAFQYRCQQDRPVIQHAHAVSARAPESGKNKDIAKLLQKADIKLPDAPVIIAELNDVLADPFATSNDVAQVVGKSPSLASLLLRIVNSAYYGFLSRIDKISRAVTIIGTKEISGLALAISVMKVFEDIPPQLVDMPSFIRHSLACGMIARILAALQNLKQTEPLFVSGLLHDIGKLIVFKYFPAHAVACQEAATRCGGPVFESEKEVLGFSHSQIGKYLIKKWKLPSNLENDIVYHHAPSLSTDSHEAVIVQMADLIANSLGIGHSGERVIPGLDYSAWAKTGISHCTVTTVMRQAVHQLAPMEAAFNG